MHTLIQTEENVVYDHNICEPVGEVASMYIYSTAFFDNFKQRISVPHVTNATIIFEIVSDLFNINEVVVCSHLF